MASIRFGGGGQQASSRVVGEGEQKLEVMGLDIGSRMLMGFST
jgi:hypothetical protein